MEATPVRPTLLQVLCILTFSWAGLSILMALLEIPNLYVPMTENPQLEFTLQSLRDQFPELESGMQEFLVRVDQLKIPNWIMNFIGNCFSLMGALMMWNYQKRGLYIYAMAELIPPTISCIYFLTSDVADPLGSMSTLIKAVMALAYFFILLFDALFIFLYSMNRKYFN